MGRSFALETCTIMGAEAIPVRVEIDIGPGLPGFHIVGLGDTAVQEARHRVRSALRSSGYKVPDALMIVNLAPGPLKKTGSGFDLPIAVALLCATGQIDCSWVKGALLVGELSLDGAVRSVPGLLACATLAKREGLALVSAPTSELARDIGVICHALVSVGRLRTDEPWFEHPQAHDAPNPLECDYSDIVGQDIAKRAMQIAAAGGLGVLLQGPPGSGKTMLARRLVSILPPLDDKQIVETSLIHSVAGLPLDDVFAGRPPFRHPHHSATVAGLVGGGNPIIPGEASLAHNGVLFLDEMNEFAPHALQALRQPVEDGEITLVRADCRVRFPARFMLVGAANPCPCGYLGDPDHECRCTPQQVSRYASRIGGPLMDRIHMVIDVWRVDPECVMKTGQGTSSAELRGKVLAAREFSAWRKSCMHLDSNLSDGEKLIARCAMDDATRKTFEEFARRGHLSGRGVMSVLKIARTIADMENRESVDESDILESMTYRVRVG